MKRWAAAPLPESRICAIDGCDADAHDAVGPLAVCELHRSFVLELLGSEPNVDNRTFTESKHPRALRPW